MVRVGVDKKIISSSEQVDSFNYWLLNKQSRLQAGHRFEEINGKAR
jgi:hypothetical protein